MNTQVIYFIFCTLFALVAYYKKSLTKLGSLTAWILSLIICFCGGFTGFIVLFITFISTIVISKISSSKRDKVLSTINQKHGKRDHIQVLANILIATLSLIIYSYTKDIIYLVAYAAVMASSLADTFASDLGVLSSKSPIDILTLKTTASGLSGGVSILGILSSLLASLIIASIFYLTTNTHITLSILILIMGVVGALIDSILGSSVQTKYKCLKCAIITEKKIHCNTNTKYLRGIKFINNDVVNLLNNIIIFIITTVLLNCLFY